MKKTLAAVALTATLCLPAVADDSVAIAPDKIRPLLIGATVPSTKLVAADGQAVDLAAVLSRKPTVVVFYRGGW
ncbi:MAG: hypothetical protein GTN89_05345 [Acidobacteria bacterium]|nr:hypothetical protein [Acidobacteriota bacterium]NIO60569.1 hypothetical protein [Acidobacteriota bacterium]NIQ29793.1 hypothetical protein [Acidobacteriota bacterium]NIQ84131.1 hypothetical protein [Acidobacteriota bacterium]